MQSALSRIRFIALALFVSLAGTSCATRASFDRTYSSWLGSNIEEFAKAYGPARKISREGEFTVYEYPIAYGKNCVVFWLCDESGVIRKWRREGDCYMPVFEL